ncbi:hypothetical protein Tco_0913513 [Tanacetum coccineum]
MEERAKFLHDTITAQRRFLAEKRAAAIRNIPPTRTQLRSQMMTYLKHVGNKKHSDLKNKTFEEIQALYEKVKRFDESFNVIGSTEDERKIKEMNKGVSDPDKKKKFVKEDVSTKVPAKQDVAEQGTKKRKELEDGTVIHMLVERRYPLSKDLVQRMLDFGLEVEIESTATLELISTNKKEVSTDRPEEGTDKQKVSTDKEEVSTDIPDEGTVYQIEGRSAIQTAPTTTPTIFGDDQTIAQVLLNMSQAKAISREKEKGVELKDVENIEIPRPTSTRSLLTLKPLLKIDPKDKGKKKIEEDESETESEDINESEKKFKMLAHDKDIARKVQED